MWFDFEMMGYPKYTIENTKRGYDATGCVVPSIESRTSLAPGILWGVLPLCVQAPLWHPASIQYTYPPYPPPASLHGPSVTPKHPRTRVPLELHVGSRWWQLGCTAH